LLLALPLSTEKVNLEKAVNSEISHPGLKSQLDVWARFNISFFSSVKWKYK
jgi:hypothetical protein